MQSSSTAYIAGIILVVAVVLSYFPIYLTPDALAQTVLPSPALTDDLAPHSSTVSGTLSGQVVAPPNVKKTTLVEAPPMPAATSSQASTYPRLVIPSLGLNDTIVPVGLTSGGAMAVPSGKTNDVGWYDGGPQPGQPGSAVLDAHVFAAFAKLNNVQVGDPIYVQNEDGTQLEFKVTAVKEFALSHITSEDLFTPTGDRDLNLITCAGELTPDHSTYDHRLVIYTTLVN